MPFALLSLRSPTKSKAREKMQLIEISEKFYEPLSSLKKDRTTLVFLHEDILISHGNSSPLKP